MLPDELATDVDPYRDTGVYPDEDEDQLEYI
jgi:hypothetical protein